MSRYVKVAFTKLNSVAEDTEASSVNQFFHILKSVEQQKGLCYVDESGKYEYTIYSSCINTEKVFITTQFMIIHRLQLSICIRKFG